VEIKSIAREAGFRSKIAVAAKQKDIDPVGCCVGLRGIRIQNIVSETNGEKIDVVMWSDDPATFIASALSPARILSVDLNKADQIAVVIVPDKQLSLAIGKEGQNARLAAKLTGWRIDIKSASAAEAEKTPVTKAAVKAEKVKAVEAELPVTEELPTEIELAPEELGITEEPAETEEVPIAAGTAPPVDEILAPPQIVLEPSETEGKATLRFAEDIMGVRRAKTGARTARSKKKKKGTYARDTGEDSVKARKGRRDYEVVEDEEDIG
jgi:N utilization substance protein A